ASTSMARCFCSSSECSDRPRLPENRSESISNASPGKRERSGSFRREWLDQSEEVALRIFAKHVNTVARNEPPLGNQAAAAASYLGAYLFQGFHLDSDRDTGHTRLGLDNTAWNSLLHGRFRCSQLPVPD